MDDKDKSRQEDKDLLQKVTKDSSQKHSEESETTPVQTKKRQIKIELGRRYSSYLPIHIVVSFIINFILMFSIVKLLRLADIRNDLVFFPIAILFTAYEESIKAYLFRKQVKLVIYTSGLIFFFSYIVFFYFLDLSVFRTSFAFKDVAYPIIFILLLQISRTIVKTSYLMWVKRLNRWTNSSSRK
jgi:hypothetical protein